MVKPWVFAGLALSALLASPTSGQQSDKKTGAPTAGVTAPSKQDYSQEPFVIEQFHTRARFENDGTGRRELHVRVRVQSEAGVQQLGQLVFGYNSVNERLAIDYVRVHKADGTTTNAPADAMQDMTAPIAQGAPVYTDYRQKHVTVPGLRPAETLEYQISTHLHTALAPGHFWFEHDFLKDVIVLDEQLELNVPADRTLKLKTQPGKDPAIAAENGRRVYRWKRSNLVREVEDESKPKKKPRRESEAPAVQLTTFQSWEEVGRWYAPLVRERSTPSAKIREKAQELVRERTTDQERIEALYGFVAKNFRYVSLSFGLGRYQPHASSEVLANQYGDCKDKHTLLASLVEAIGLRAYPALIHSTRKIDPEVPSPAQFDHMITAIPVGKEWIWLDTTTEVAPFRMLSANLRKKKALLIPTERAQAAQDQQARLEETPPDTPFPASQRADVEGELSELGKLTARVHYTLRGDAELLLRLAFRRTPEHQWKQLGQLMSFSDGFRGEASDVKAGDPGATNEPFQVEYRISQANYLDWSRKRSQLALPLPALGLPEASEEEPEGGTPEPIELGTPLTVVTRVQLDLPARFAARAPVPVAVLRDYAEYRSSYQVVDKRVIAERTLRFQMRELPAARARDYAAFTRAVRADEAQTLAMESATPGAPAIPSGAKPAELYESGMAAFRAGNLPGAIDLLKRVVELEPKHKWAWNDLGRAHLGLRQLDEATRAFRKQIEMNPYDEYAYNNLGRALWQQQKHDAAIEAFRKQIEVSPLDRWAHANLGMLYGEQRRYAEAVPELEKAASLTPDDPGLLIGLGDAYLNLKDETKALATFDKAVQLAPAAPTWNNIAYQLARKRIQLERALQYAESAVTATAAELRNASLDQLSPIDLGRVAELAAYWDTLGWVHFQRDDLEKAEKYISASWMLGQHGEVGDHLGQIHEKRGQKQETLRTYRQALAATQPAPETRGRLAALLGGDEKIPALVSKAGEELSEQRKVKLGKLLKEQASGEFLVLLEPPPAGAAGSSPKVAGVKFVSGSEKLRPLAEALRTARFPALFPDEKPTKLVRRGILSCSSATGECVFVLYLPDQVRTVD